MEPRSAAAVRGVLGRCGQVTVLSRLTADVDEDPFGPGDPLEVARLVRRALAAAHRHAIDVRVVMVATDRPPSQELAARFVRRTLGPHGADVPCRVVGETPDEAAEVRVIQMLDATRKHGPDQPPGVAMVVVRGPGNRVRVLCVA